MKIFYLGPSNSARNNQPEIRRSLNTPNIITNQKFNTVEQQKELISLNNNNNNNKSNHFLKNENNYVKKIIQENCNSDMLSKSSILEVIEYPSNKFIDCDIKKNDNFLRSFIRNSPKIIQGDTDPDIELDENDFEIEKKKKKKTDKDKIYFNANQIKKYFISPKIQKFNQRINSRNKLKNKINTLNKSPNSNFKKTTDVKLKKKKSSENIIKNRLKIEKLAEIFSFENKNNNNNHIKNKSKEKYASNKSNKEYNKSTSRTKIENNDQKIYSNCNSIFEILNETIKGEKTDINNYTNNSSNKINNSKISTCTKSKKSQQIKPDKNSIIIYFPKKNIHLKSKKNIFMNVSPKKFKNYKLNNPFENIINSSRIYFNHYENNTSNIKKNKIINLRDSFLRSSKNSSNNDANNKNKISKSNNADKKNIFKLKFGSPKIRQKTKYEKF